MLILIESRSMLIVYWLGDRKLINAYFTNNKEQNIYLPKEFLKIQIDVLSNIHQCACISLFIKTLFSIIMFKKEISVHLCKLGNALNANEEMLACYADPDAT